MELKEQILQAVPESKRHLITEDLLSTIEEATKVEGVGEAMLENFLTYASVLQTGNYSMHNYINAIRFITHKLSGVSNLRAYTLAYKDKYASLRAKYSSLTIEEFHSKISPYVHAVAKGKLVSTILSQVQIPMRILNLGLLQEALNVEAELMRNAKSETVREKAANTLINYLGQDEGKVELQITADKSDMIAKWEEAMKGIVRDKRLAVQQGADLKMIANAGVIDV